MTRSLRATVAALAAVATFVGVALGRSGPSAPTRAAACHATLTLLGHGQGAPDDLAWAGHKLLVSDIHRGTIGLFAGGRTRTVARGLREPEGMVAGASHTLIVAEQGTNRVSQVALSGGAHTTLARLPLPAGKTGVDGLGSAGSGRVFVPDSARGRLYVLDLRTRRLTLVASGMNRPVAAIRWHGAIVVADEYANAVWRITGGRRSRLAAVAVPDDFAVISGHLIAVSLIGSVWEVAPHLRLLSSAFVPTTSDPQGIVADGPSAVLLADQSRNAIYRLSHLSSCL